MGRIRREADQGQGQTDSRRGDAGEHGRWTRQELTQGRARFVVSLQIGY